MLGQLGTFEVIFPTQSCAGLNRYVILVGGGVQWLGIYSC